jgi:hypothetical protein
MKTNRINAPPSYAQAGQKKPVDANRPAPSAPQVRIYICIDCRHSGGTLFNIGTHKEPRYICAECKKLREKRTVPKTPPPLFPIPTGMTPGQLKRFISQPPRHQACPPELPGSAQDGRK